MNKLAHAISSVLAIACLHHVHTIDVRTTVKAQEGGVIKDEGGPLMA
jgi:hypothetical protein